MFKEEEDDDKRGIIAATNRLNRHLNYTDI